MKFMKLGSKPDQFQTEGDNIRYVATDLATDMTISVGDVKFYVHKFPLLSKSSHLQKLVANSSNDTDGDISVNDIPGGPAAFEICAKFCYGMVVTLNAYNVVAARCAAEYLEMFETVEKGNLIYKIDVFLTSSIFRSWKDSIIALQTTKSFLPWSEELKIASHCIDSIASRACVDPSKVDWSYTYNWKKLPSENGKDPHWNGVKKQEAVPSDWWVEDLCELPIDTYKRVITTIRTKDKMPEDVIGEALKAYAVRKISGISKGTIQGHDLVKYCYFVETITRLLPVDRSSVSCGFLLKLLQASIMLECGETGRHELMRKISQQLDEATVADLILWSPTGETVAYDVDVVHNLVEQFVVQECGNQTECLGDSELVEVCHGFASDESKLKVARLVDGYLAEASRDAAFPLSKFVSLAEMVSSFPRPSHDGIYRAIDMFLKEHPELTKSEKKRICRLMDCRKLSPDACAHAVQNERLPLRVVVQVLFFDQSRVAAAATASGSNTPNAPTSVRALLPGGSCGSSRSATTNSDEDWDNGDQTSGELKELKGELASLRLRNNKTSSGHDAKSNNSEKETPKKGRKMLSKLWSSKDENSSTDTSEATSADEMKAASIGNAAAGKKITANQIQKKLMQTK